MLSLFHAVRAEKVIAINAVKVRGQVKRNRLLKVGSKSQNIIFQFSFLLNYIVIQINFIFKTFEFDFSIKSLATVSEKMHIMWQCIKIFLHTAK